MKEINQKILKGKDNTEPPHSLDIYIGQRLRALRMTHGESQEKLGKRCRLTFQQIQKYEKGINHLSHKRAFEIAQAYAVPIGYFTDGFEENLLADFDDADLALSRATLQLIKQYNKLDNATQKAVLGVLNAVVSERQAQYGK